MKFVIQLFQSLDIMIELFGNMETFVKVYQEKSFWRSIFFSTIKNAICFVQVF